MKCSICNAEISNASKFCNHCGSKIEVQGKTCPNSECGRTGLPPEAMFCPDCGTKLTNNFASFTETVNGVSFDMVVIEEGTFMMAPNYEVSLSKYHIGKTVVTQELWKIVMNNNPSNFKGDNLPVVNISWEDCQTFIKRINQLTGKKYSLPTEAQWEFAARGGNLSKCYKYAGSNISDEVAWYYENNLTDQIHPVAQKHSNELGLFDMSGNVWEWCQDWYDEYPQKTQINPAGPELYDYESCIYRICRGGGWFCDAYECSVNYRHAEQPDSLSSDIGLRLSLS